MRGLPHLLIILASIGLLIGLVIRLVKTGLAAGAGIFGDPVFFWRGSMALLLLAIAIVLVQMRNK